MGGGEVNKEIINICKVRGYEGLNSGVTMQIEKIEFL